MSDESGSLAILSSPPMERIAKPWGEELILARSDDTVHKLLRIDPLSRLSLQFHRRKHETLTLLSGACLLELGPDSSQLSPHQMKTGERFDIPAGMRHRLSAAHVGAVILEHAQGCHGDHDDIVRLADDYGRA